ncbi:MAG: hypothetical protein PSV16_14710 [Flavobacterium sp.]|nr:hypothetical protein [Flavobacterium sp.]
MNQLSRITTRYQKFKKGQYIKDPQFNDFLDFFEDQDRLSRVLLQGVGNVCGFEHQLFYTDTTNTKLRGISLSQGIAITTDGDLLTLNNTSKPGADLYASDLKTIDIDSKLYTHFKVYDDSKAKYPAFFSGSTQINTWELATANEAKPGFQPISNLGSLEDKSLLLYLESYEKEIKPCRGVDCDNFGILQVRNLKVLLTDTDGIDQLLETDNLYAHPLINNNLVEQKIKRVTLKPSLSSSTSIVDSMKAAYKTTADDNDYYNDLFKQVKLIATFFGIPTVSNTPFRTRMRQVLDGGYGFQYSYDVMKDLTDTYAEIMALLPKSFAKSLPDFLSFPKHIMLGTLTATKNPDYTRHQFYNSPVLDDEKIISKIKFLLQRFNQQVQNFVIKSLPYGEVKITPSREMTALSNRAIPFYYETEDLVNLWNFQKTSNRASNTNMAFDSSDLLPAIEFTQHPLEYNLDKKSFFNIEGHQGMNYPAALQSIKALKNQKNLSFDVMAVSIENLNDNKDLSKAYLKEYLEKHPGLEHTGGVPKNGTFVMLFKSEREQQVIADFSLPYICCTPKEQVKLSLPANTVCANASRLPFTVWPMNGVVTSTVASASIESVNGQYFFNPAKVDKSLHGQEIKFLVNNKEVNFAVKVVTQADVDIALGSINYPEGGSNATVVNFTVSGPNFMDYDYSWDFLGNGNYVVANPDFYGNVTYTFYNLSPTSIPAIKVLVSGNGCSQSIPLNNWYPSTFTINSITFPKGSCCSAPATPYYYKGGSIIGAL